MYEHLYVCRLFCLYSLSVFLVFPPLFSLYRSPCPCPCPLCLSVSFVRTHRCEQNRCANTTNPPTPAAYRYLVQQTVQSPWFLRFFSPAIGKMQIGTMNNIISTKFHSRTVFILRSTFSRHFACFTDPRRVPRRGDVNLAGTSFAFPRANDATDRQTEKKTPHAPCPYISLYLKKRRCTYTRVTHPTRRAAGGRRWGGGGKARA